jgi:hypothetical protein
MFLKISSIRGVMRFEKEWEIGIQGCLTPRPDNSFLNIILRQYTYSCFGLKDRQYTYSCFGLKDSCVGNSLFSSISYGLDTHRLELYMELLDLGVKIDKDWYSVGNTEYDVGILRFKDYICMVNLFLVVCLFVIVLSNRYMWIL